MASPLPLATMKKAAPLSLAAVSPPDGAVALTARELEARITMVSKATVASKGVAEVRYLCQTGTVGVLRACNIW